MNKIATYLCTLILATSLAGCSKSKTYSAEEVKKGIYAECMVGRGGHLGYYNPYAVTCKFQNKDLVFCSRDKKLNALLITSCSPANDDSKGTTNATYCNQSNNDAVISAKKDFDRCNIDGVILEFGEHKTSDIGYVVSTWSNQKVHVIQN